MLKWICAVALAMAVASPAMAQKPKDRAMKMLKTFDVEIIKEGIRAIKQSGQCTVTYVVGKDSKPKDMTADCTIPEFAPYAIRAVESAEWQSEITGGEYWDSDPIKQTFKFGAVSAPDPRGEKAPVLVTPISQGDVERVINKTDKAGTCSVVFTVGADGKPKDIQPNCTMAAFNAGIAEAVGKMVYTPGQKDGAPTDWPNMNMPMNLTKPTTTTKN